MATNDLYAPLDSVPTYTANRKLTANPYQQGSNEARLYDAYQSSLGRDPEAGIINWRVSQLPNRNIDQQLSDIGGSGESYTYGRARNEVNPLIDSQITAAMQDAANQRTVLEGKLESLAPQYARKRSDLDFGYNTNLQGYEKQLADLYENTDISSRRLNDQLGQVPLQAMNFAGRAGMLNSTLMVDRLAGLQNPLAQALQDLYRTSDRRAGDINTSEQSLRSKYGSDVQNLGLQETTDVKGLRDQFAQLLANALGTQTQLESSRAPQISARAGTLQDALDQLNLQRNSQTQDYQKFQQQLQESARQFNATLAEQQRQFNKK